jgi:hypothetical protein
MCCNAQCLSVHITPCLLGMSEREGRVWAWSAGSGDVLTVLKRQITAGCGLRCNWCSGGSP